MKKVQVPRKAGLRAAASAMFRSRGFRAKFGKDLQQLGLAALVGSAAAFFPFSGSWHPFDGGLLLGVSVVSYAIGAIINFKNGG